jgi:hypothetical protein
LTQSIASHNMVHTAISKKAASTPTTGKSPPLSSSKINPIIVEACQGPDCFGSGGGAVLLELEDLVQEYHDKTNGDGQCFRVVAGGCRNFCSMGPNVYVSGAHFESVKEIEECRKIANDIDLCIIPSEDSSTTSVISKMLWKRAHRLRWQALRDLARFKKNKATNPEVMRGQLQEVLGAELAAAAKSNDPEAAVRAQRRHQRLENELSQVVLRRAEESDDDESDDDEDARS